MHVNDEELTCEYEGKNAEARVAVLRPVRGQGWRVVASQYLWGEGVGAYYCGQKNQYTYHCRDRISAVKRFKTLSAAMVAVFCGGAR